MIGSIAKEGTMNIDQVIIDRLQHLIEQGEHIRMLKTPEGVISFTTYVDTEAANQWGTSCLNLLGRVFSKESDYYVKFNNIFGELHKLSYLQAARGILKAAKDDYEHGYLFKTRVLIRAEVFDDFLEQASYLLKNGYHAPAAVVIGSVLEDGLRKLCVQNNINLPPKPKIDAMNADLAKAGIYNQLVQKRITALADLRNKAAHGQWSEFTANDVEQMLSQVRIFMENYFS
jgi:hypothetical protein